LICTHDLKDIGRLASLRRNFNPFRRQAALPLTFNALIVPSIALSSYRSERQAMKSQYGRPVERFLQENQSVPPNNSPSLEKKAATR
jgi:hypothetical protein